MEWIIPIIAIAVGAVIVAFFLIPKRKSDEKITEGNAPRCPGCGVSSCAAMGGEVDIEAIRKKLKERARESAYQ